MRHMNLAAVEGGKHCRGTLGLVADCTAHRQADEHLIEIQAHPPALQYITLHGGHRLHNGWRDEIHFMIDICQHLYGIQNQG